MIFNSVSLLTGGRKGECVRVAGILTMLAAMPIMAEEHENRPEIVANSVSVVQKEDSPLVEIAYTLTGEPAIVTIAIETNTLVDASGDWVAVNGKGMEELLGEANKIVYTLDAPAKAFWKPSAEFNGSVLPPGTVRATVTAWPTNNPPNYMVVDLLPLNEQEHLFPNRRYRYYATTNELPGGIKDDRYRISKLLMRKIPAKNVVWLMGSPTKLDDPNRDTTNDVPHKVMFTEDYYAGVFELTIGQLKCVDLLDSLGASKISDCIESDVADLIPADRIGYFITDLRGKPADYTFVKNGRAVKNKSVIDVLRRRTSISDLDLPTEAQWEYACRAGSGNVLPGNMPYTEETLRSMAWKKDHYYKHSTLNKNGPAPVGMLLPNEWGLYDTIGNVAEICLDMVGYDATAAVAFLDEFKESLAEGWESGAVTVDPKGANHNTTGRNMVRGGGWRDQDYPYTSTFCRINQQADKSPDTNKGKIGVRLFCSVKEAVK